VVEFKAFPSIEQYRHVVKIVRERAQFDGKPLPTLMFYGSVKLHGTNAAVGFDENGEMFFQSRNQLISPEQDNAGFARWASANQNVFPKLKSAVIYGEWCGQGVMGGTGISQLPKMFIPFAILSGDRWWSPEELKTFFFHSGLRCIYDFPSWTMLIDFSRPEELQNYLVDLTVKVEQQCPVALALGVEGIGEGIVWWAASCEGFNTDGLIFKVKGKKHSETKVKTLAAVDIEKIGNIWELVATIATPHRMEKKLEGISVDIKNTGTFLKAVTEDVMKEESDTIDASGLPKTDVMRGVSMAAKQFFMERVNSI
jgi:hypothetical protein